MSQFEYFQSRQTDGFLSALAESYLLPAKPPLPQCPVCGEELDIFGDIYVYHGGDEVVGCPHCICTYTVEEFLPI